LNLLWQFVSELTQLASRLRSQLWQFGYDPTRFSDLSQRRFGHSADLFRLQNL